MSKQTKKAKNKAKKAKWAKYLPISKVTEPFEQALDYRDYPEDSALLCLMHSYKRPHDTKSEREFTKVFVDSLPHVEKDMFGNRHVIVGKDKPRIMFSCHVDTVHNLTGRQKVKVSSDGILTLASAAGSNCLGADDTAGVWLMREMIKAEIPGLYTFHRGEEVGGLGSTYIASQERERLKGIDACIAFDRKGYGDVITSQWGKCASDEFAQSVADMLGGQYKPDDTGLFTDSANYDHLIPECSNLSVGYFRQHGPNESLNLGFLLWLRDRCISIDWQGVEIAREPGDDGYGGYGRSYRLDDSGPRGNESYYGKQGKTLKWERSRLDPLEWDGSSFDDDDSTGGQGTRVYDLKAQTLKKLSEYTYSYPNSAARLIYNLGGDVSDLAEAIYEETGEIVGPYDTE